MLYSASLPLRVSPLGTVIDIEQELHRMLTGRTDQVADILIHGSLRADAVRLAPKTSTIDTTQGRTFSGLSAVSDQIVVAHWIRIPVGRHDSV